MLTGSVYLLRSNNLPAAVTNGHVTPLPIAEDTDLGEPMCFAFHPEVGASLVHYAHNGPRHSALSCIVGRFAPHTAITVEPVIRTDILASLQQKQIFRGFEFSLSEPRGIADLRTYGGSVENAIEILSEVNGVNISVNITMGHTRGGSLDRGVINNLARRLMAAPRVSSIKVRGSDGEGAPIENLDLLKAREEISLQVTESNRAIDTNDTCRQLKAALARRLPGLRRQIGG